MIQYLSLLLLISSTTYTCYITTWSYQEVLFISEQPQQHRSPTKIAVQDLSQKQTNQTPPEQGPEKIIIPVKKYKHSTQEKINDTNNQRNTQQKSTKELA